MAEYDNPISALLQRPSNAQQTVRNIRVTAGDDFTITVTAYADEDANAPTPIGGTAFLSVFDLQGNCAAWGWDRWSSFDWDYGSLGWGRYLPKLPILQIQGTYGPNISMVFAFAPVMTQLWRGRYAFIIQGTVYGGGSTIARGILDVEPGLIFPGDTLYPFVLDQSSLDGEDVIG